MPQPILNPDGGVQYIATDVNDVIQTGGVSDETTTTAAKSAKFGAAYLRAPSNAPMIAHAYVRGTAGGYEAGTGLPGDGKNYVSASIDTGNTDEKAIIAIGWYAINNTRRGHIIGVSDDDNTWEDFTGSSNNNNNEIHISFPIIGNFRYLRFGLLDTINRFVYFTNSANDAYLTALLVTKVITVNFYATDTPDDITGGALLKTVKAFYNTTVDSGALEIPPNKYLTIIVDGPTADYKVQLERVTAVYTPN